MMNPVEYAEFCIAKHLAKAEQELRVAQICDVANQYSIPTTLDIGVSGVIDELGKHGFDVLYAQQTTAGYRLYAWGSTNNITPENKEFLNEHADEILLACLSSGGVLILLSEQPIARN
jgi:hypothetical protein